MEVIVLTQFECEKCGILYFEGDRFKIDPNEPGNTATVMCNGCYEDIEVSKFILAEDD